MRSFLAFVLGFLFATVLAAAAFFAYKLYCPDATTTHKCCMTPFIPQPVPKTLRPLEEEMFIQGKISVIGDDGPVLLWTKEGRAFILNFSANPRLESIAKSVAKNKDIKLVNVTGKIYQDPKNSYLPLIKVISITWLHLEQNRGNPPNPPAKCGDRKSVV